MNIKTGSTIGIACVKNDGQGRSYFDKRDVNLNGNEERMLSEQIQAVNFRLRTSTNDYESDWHVAGDSTLLIMLSGCVEIILRDGSSKEFSAGDMFIAEDYLKEGVVFDEQTHGHRARVSGQDKIKVLHLKLAKRE